MDEKKCKYCAMVIPKDASICPYCRKSQGWSSGAKILLTLLAVIFILAIFGRPDHETSKTTAQKSNPVAEEVRSFTPATEDLPSFKVVGKDLTSLSILVPPNTSKKQLKNLIFEFKKARGGNYLSKMIPPTTKGGEFGEYALVFIFVFSDPQWASTFNLRRYYNVNVRNPSDKQFNKIYGRQIRGEYGYSSLEECGTIGFEDGIVRTKDYQKLF